MLSLTVEERVIEEVLTLSVQGTETAHFVDLFHIGPMQHTAAARRA